MTFKDRKEAGHKLAEKLMAYKDNKNVIILAIPRGGVEVGYGIAKELNLKLDIIVTKKIGLLGNEEFAIGAIGPDKKPIVEKKILRIYNVKDEYIDEAAKELGEEIERRYMEYKGEYNIEPLKDKIVILVDDGVATGMTAKAALMFIRNQNPRKIILAVPVAPPKFRQEIERLVDEYIFLLEPEKFFSVGEFYQDFGQLADEDVKILLNKP